MTDDVVFEWVLLLVDFDVDTEVVDNSDFGVVDNCGFEVTDDFDAAVDDDVSSVFSEPPFSLLWSCLSWKFRTSPECH